MTKAAKVWITKYALTEGIFQVTAMFDSDVDKIASVAGDIQRGTVQTYYHKPFWHEHKADALRHAEELRRRKIAALERQIAKLLKLRFR
jgi:hypothetical protein